MLYHGLVMLSQVLPTSAADQPSERADEREGANVRKSRQTFNTHTHHQRKYGRTSERSDDSDDRGGGHTDGWMDSQMNVRTD